MVTSGIFRWLSCIFASTAVARSDSTHRKLLVDSQLGFGMSWLTNLVPPPDSREQLTRLSFIRNVVPALLCYYVTAILVLLPNTLSIRLSILPFSLWACFHGATRLDLVKPHDNEGLMYINQGLVGMFTMLAMRMMVWTFKMKPIWRVSTLGEVTSQFYTTSPPTLRPKELFVAAFELCCNLRGIGWSWSQNLHIPRETRPTRSKRAFVIATATQLVIHVVMIDILIYAIQSLAPTTVGSARGGSIFEADLKPSLRYAKAILLTFLTGMFTYSILQAGYLFYTLAGVLIFRQHISLWPPAFEAPWLSTSLNEFWSKRWHQFFRDPFFTLGGYPMLLLFVGRAGAVLGTFFMSSILHSFAFWGMGRGTDFMRVGGYFIVNGIGVLLEHIWRSVTGRRVGGWCGRIWTYIWIVGWGHFLVEAWAVKGFMSGTFLPRYLRLTAYIMGPAANR
ncbi:hypothetical protein FPV67DRAFT_221191 [Lyophyllum atratum]|nr:hypothetical protein FPV67DRAFT_221191 [Lyophyllum atratum]